MPSMRLATMQHFAPHPSAKFEGYYSKFDLASGAHIILIICSVPDAPDRAHYVCFLYYPQDGTPIFQREHFVANIERMTLDNQTKAFDLRVPGMGSMRTEANGTTSYILKTDDWSLDCQTESFTPWKKDKSTPEGWMVYLPFPLHWHVHSLASPCSLNLSIPSLGDDLAHSDRTGRGVVHQEKNWANSFPAAHMWIQARDSKNDKGICLAGGKIMGQTAYMVGYRSPSLQVDFVPPFSVSFLNIFSPFMSVTKDWASRTFNISVSNYFYKLDLTAQAPPGKGWFGLSTPFPDGHRHNYCTESFLATIRVTISQRQGWMPWSAWKKLKTDVFENGSLEFAGEYYPDRGHKGE